jgi:hypothetical protein
MKRVSTRNAGAEVLEISGQVIFVDFDPFVVGATGRRAAQRSREG